MDAICCLCSSSVVVVAFTVTVFIFTVNVLFSLPMLLLFHCRFCNCYPVLICAVMLSFCDDCLHRCVVDIFATVILVFGQSSSLEDEISGRWKKDPER